ncbi:MAG: DNA replication protein DnaC [Candidatus Solibacter usitatus]|nr:DNA replication protein DnaC [Candidatus Solibacter usitatus]
MERGGEAMTPDALSTASPVARELYKELLRALKPLGSFKTEVKKTSIHLARKSAFAGVHPRKEHLLLTIKAAKPIRNKRIVKSEQVSKSRWHEEVKVAAAGDIDAELLGWLRDAYELCA